MPPRRGGEPLHLIYCLLLITRQPLRIVAPESGDYVTVAGLLLQRLGNLPTGGEVVEIAPYRVSITTLAGRRIARVRIENVHTAQPA